MDCLAGWRGAQSLMGPFQLKDNAGHIAIFAWSMWAWYLAFLFIVLDTALPFLQPLLGLPDWAFGLASGLCSAAGLVARVLVQRNIAG